MTTGTEGMAGTLLGSVLGVPELGRALEVVNEGSKLVLEGTKDIPLVGDITQGVDTLMDGVKEVPLVGDILDLFV